MMKLWPYPFRCLLLVLAGCYIVDWQQSTYAFHVTPFANQKTTRRPFFPNKKSCSTTTKITRINSNRKRKPNGPSLSVSSIITSSLLYYSYKNADRQPEEDEVEPQQRPASLQLRRRTTTTTTRRIIRHNDNNYYDDGGINEEEESRIPISSVVKLPLETAAIPTPSSHFYSRKSLQDPSFRFMPDKKNKNSNYDLDGRTTTTATTNNDVFADLCRAAGNLERPSKIQAISWPIVLKGSHCIIADQTGSGKTYAYLLPLLQRMVYYDDDAKQHSSLSVAAPQLLILAPTSELADQIHTVVSKLLLGMPKNHRRFRSMVLTATGGYATNIRDQIRFLEQQQHSHHNIDILVSTPGRIATILRMRQCQSRIVSLERMAAVVFDEVDILLLDPSFAPQLETIGQAIKKKTSTATATTSSTTTTTSDNKTSSSRNNNKTNDVQFVFCTATLPDKVLSTIQCQFPTVELCQGPGLHKIAPTVKDTLVDVSVSTAEKDSKKEGTNVKNEAVLNALRLNRCRRTLIFANTVSSCRAVVNAIQRHDRSHQLYWVDSYHNAMTIPSRQNALQTFIRAENENSNNNNNNGDAKNAKSYILVATDRAARGVELGIVDHIIIYDFGNSPAEYMRRVGRTARAGRPGSVTVLAYGWQLPIARQLLVSSSSTTAKTSQSQSGSAKDNTNGDGSKNRRKKRPTTPSSLDEGMFAEDDQDDEEEWSFRKKKQQKLVKPVNYIGESIASGKVWNDGKDGVR